MPRTRGDPSTPGGDLVYMEFVLVWGYRVDSSPLVWVHLCWGHLGLVSVIDCQYLGLRAVGSEC